jgi:hypothetical protein
MSDGGTPAWQRLGGDQAFDGSALRTALERFLVVARSEGFGPPPPGEWTAACLLAHVAVANFSIASAAVAVAAGEFVSYDNRSTLDEFRLRRVVERCGSSAGLTELVGSSDETLRMVAERISVAYLATEAPTLIV